MRIDISKNWSLKARHKLVNVPTGLDHLKTNVNDLNVDKFKTALVEFKKLRDAWVKNSA